MATTKRVSAFIALARALTSARRAGQPGVGERLRSVPRLAAAVLTGRYHGTSAGQLGLMLLAVVYIVSPVDAIPDLILPLGLADDALVTGWLAGRLLDETDRFLLWERDPDRLRPTPRFTPRRRSRRPGGAGGVPDDVQVPVQHDTVPGQVLRG